MPKKTKATVKAHKLGHHGAMLRLLGAIPGVGSVTTDVKADMETDRLAAIADESFAAAEKLLSSLEFDIEDQASIEAFGEAYKQGMIAFYLAIRDEVTA